MSKGTRATIARMIAAGGLSAGLLASAHAHAQGAEPGSQDVTINLIRLLVKQHVITQQAADALLKEAEQVAAKARTGQIAKAVPATPAELPPPAPDAQRVPYVPKIVKDQIRDEVKQEVIQEAREENWAQPQAVPEWTKRIKVQGDFRFRDEADLFSTQNDDQIVDYATFNANGPTDANASHGHIPFLNTTADRLDRLSIRARLGVDATIADGVLFGLRLASGGDNGPVSTTQLLGGGFGKKDFWLDQAYLTLGWQHQLDLTVGRMPNPFVHSDLVYDPDLNFDGAALSADSLSADAKGWGVFATEGIFPLGYIGSNFPDHGIFLDQNGQPTGAAPKANDHQKWLWGNQIGAEWRGERLDWRFAASYYDFASLQGQLSAPCAPYLGATECSTDYSRPAYMQKGNTLFAIRQNVFDSTDPDPANPQFVGLSFKYKLINATSEVSYAVSDKYRFRFDFDFVHNLAYRRGEACRYAPFGVPITNIRLGAAGYADACDLPGPQQQGATIAQLESGPDGYYVSTTFGDTDTRKRWAWNVSLGYKYLEPDAVPDAYTDSDFHLGGTNARGFIVGGSLGLFNDTWLTARWLSASEVFGPPMAIDVVQLDLNAGF